MAVWKDAGPNAELRSLDAVAADEGARITAELKLPAGASRARLVYLMRDNGTVRVEMEVEPDANGPELPRVGVSFAIPGKWDRLRWFGRGPQEKLTFLKAGDLSVTTSWTLGAAAAGNDVARGAQAVALGNTLQEALERQIELIAITDHNASANVESSTTACS